MPASAAKTTDERTDPGALRARAREVRTLLFVVHKSAMRDLAQRLEAAGAGVSPPQHAVLRRLGLESATISELSGRMMLAPPTLVGIVDTLERKGLLQRGQDPQDRRRTPLQLTQSGTELVASFPMIADEDPVIQGLVNMGEGKAEQLGELLCELVSQLNPDAGVVERILADLARER